MARHLWILLVAGVLSYVLCPLIGIGARRLGIVSQPVKDRWHREPTPLLGGLAIAIGTIAAFGSFTPWDRDLLLIVGAGVAAHILGPDRRPRGARRHCEAGRLSSHRCSGGLRFGRHRGSVSMGDPARRGLVRGDCARLQPARQHGRPGGRRRCDHAVGGWRSSWWQLGRRLHPSSCSSPWRARSSDFSLEQLAGPPVHGRRRQPVHRLRPGRLLAAFPGSAADDRPVDGIAVRFFCASSCRSVKSRSCRRCAGWPDASRRAAASITHPTGWSRWGFPNGAPCSFLYAVALCHRRGCESGMARSGRRGASRSRRARRRPRLGAIYLARVPTYQGDDFAALQRVPFGAVLRSALPRSHAVQVLLDS